MCYFSVGGVKSVADIDTGAKILTFRQIHNAIITLSALRGANSIANFDGGPWPDLPPWILHWKKPKSASVAHWLFQRPVLTYCIHIFVS